MQKTLSSVGKLHRLDGSIFPPPLQRTGTTQDLLKTYNYKAGVTKSTKGGITICSPLLFFPNQLQIPVLFALWRHTFGGARM